MREFRGSTGLGRSWIALGFVVVSLVALVLVPYLMSRRVAGVQEQISDVLEPARRLATELQSTQARARAALQGFVLTGDRRYRLRYSRAREREREILDSLTVVSEQIDLSVQQHLLDLSDASFRWHLSHQEVLNRGIEREEFLSTLPREEELYGEVLGSTSDVLEAISDQVGQGRGRMADTRQLQLWITLGLLALALAATAAVAILAFRLYRTTRMAEKRRHDAVAARREADALLAATADGVFGLDLEGRCTFLNRAGSELLGYSPSEVIGRDMHELVHHSDADGEPYPRERCPASRALAAGTAVREPDDLVWRKDGSSFPAQVTARPLVDGLEVRGVVVTVSDMTETREHERALERAVRARDEVLAVVSHDLRNPVGSIDSAASLLLDVDLPQERVREHLEMIRLSARRATRLIRDLLDVTRLEAGRLELETGPVAVEALLDEALNVVRSRAEEKEVELVMDVEEGMTELEADRHRLLQVVSNLVGNAVKFSDPGGRVDVRAVRDGEGVMLEVRDRGRGMDAEEQEHLFDRFWQARRSDREGAGLGLAIVKGIVEAHGGSVAVESEPGKGSSFRIGLPANGS